MDWNGLTVSSLHELHKSQPTPGIFHKRPLKADEGNGGLGHRVVWSGCGQIPTGKMGSVCSLFNAGIVPASRPPPDRPQSFLMHKTHTHKWQDLVEITIFSVADELILLLFNHTTCNHCSIECNLCLNK